MHYDLCNCSTMSPAEPEVERPESMNNLLQAITTTYPRLNDGSQTQK